MKSKNIILVGGAGFIGSILTKKLAVNKALNVMVIHIDDLVESEKVDNIKYIKIDLSQGGQEAKEIVSKADCAVLMTQPKESLLSNFFELAKESKLKRIIYTSTMLLYPDSAEKQDETTDLEPISEYEENKYKEENLLKEFANQGNKVCIARLGNVYGNKKNKGIISLIINALNSGQTLMINGVGEHRRDYIYVEDVADALEQLILKDQAENLEIYNVCTGEGHTINQLIEELENISNKKIIRENGEEIKEKRSIVGDNKKIKNSVDFKIKFDLNQGLQEIYKNY